MILRSPAENENGGIFLHIVLSSTRHSRARGNPGLFRRISLETRFRGYDGTQAVSSFSDHLHTGIFEGGHDPSPVGFGPQGEAHEVVGAGFKPALTRTLRLKSLSEVEG